MILSKIKNIILIILIPYKIVCKSGVEAGQSSKNLLQLIRPNNQFTWQLVTESAVRLPQLQRCIIYF